MKNQLFPPGIRPVALKAVSEVDRARACPHRHASAVQLERARAVERANSTNAGATEIRFAFPLAGGLQIAEGGGVGDAGAGDVEDTKGQSLTERSSMAADAAPDDSRGSGGSVPDTQSGTAGVRSNRGRRANSGERK